MNEPFEIENQHLQISPSIGIAIYPEAGEDPLSILQHADMAMYEAKIKGKMVALCTRKNCIKWNEKLELKRFTTRFSKRRILSRLSTTN